MRLLITVALVLFIDQLSKYLAISFIRTGQPIAVIDNFLYFTFALNPGAAFGLFPYQTTFFIVVTIIAAVLIVYFYRTIPASHKWLRFGLALLLGGALGNLTDRVRATYVVDFISFRFFPPVFNLADTAIVVGVGIILIAIWRTGGLESNMCEGSRESLPTVLNETSPNKHI
ncbi:MAG TPA: signal peptidase II [Candidatus Limnocylindrales bacterium]|nr:signal peptidase II [Candidatus Limnocylindrales bacterium]